MDFFFLKRYDADKIINVTLQLIKQKLPKFVNATEYDIQVLTPMRKGLLGVERLNGILQAYMNPADKSKREKRIQGHDFPRGRQGDADKEQLSDRVGNRGQNSDFVWIRAWESSMEIQVSLRKSTILPRP